jgi:mono/diheme cytochrome c family protein
MNKAVAAVALLLFTSACQKAKNPEARGQAYFVGMGCKTCHMISGQGGGQVGPDLTYVGFRQNKEFLDMWLKNPKAWHPGTAMPNFNMTDAVRKDIIDYLATLQGDSYRQNPPWNTPELMADAVKRGEMIFNRAGCVGCHNAAGKGGYPNNNVVGGLIPSLTRVAEGYSKEELKEKIHNGVTPEPADPSKPAPYIQMPKWGDKLTDDELDSLVEYLYSILPAGKTEDWSL